MKTIKSHVRQASTSLKYRPRVRLRTLTLDGRSDAADGGQTREGRRLAGYIYALLASSPRGPVHVIHWSSRFTRRTVKGSLGRALYAFCGMVDHMELSRESFTPSWDAAAGTVGLEDCGGVFPHLSSRRMITGNIRFDFFMEDNGGRRRRNPGPSPMLIDYRALRIRRARSHGAKPIWPLFRNYYRGYPSPWVLFALCEVWLSVGLHVVIPREKSRSPFTPAPLPPRFFVMSYFPLCFLGQAMGLFFVFSVILQCEGGGIISDRTAGMETGFAHQTWPPEKRKPVSRGPIWVRPRLKAGKRGSSPRGGPLVAAG